MLNFYPIKTIHPYDKEKELDNISSLKKCTFDTFWDVHFYPTHEAHIKLRDVKGISIEGCVF